MRPNHWLLFLAVIFAGGCAGPNYFPLKNEAKFKTFFEEPKAVKKAVVLPFKVALYYEIAGIYNTQEKAEQKNKAAQEFFLQSLKEEINQYGLEITDSISIEEYEKDNADDDPKLYVAAELIAEYNDALFAVRKNLDEEKGKGFDYSIGIRAQELAGLYNPEPEYIIKMAPYGYVLNLAELEDNALNTFNKVMTLGLSKFAAGSSDTIGVDIAVIEAKTGDIIWLNSFGQFGKTMLNRDHVREVVKAALKDFNKTQGDQK